jgi:hypothetical protein
LRAAGKAQHHLQGACGLPKVIETINLDYAINSHPKVR